MIRIIFSALITSLIFMASPAYAAAQYGDWILTTDNKFCTLATQLDNGSSLFIGMEPGGNFSLTSYSPNWSLGRGETAKVDLEFSNGVGLVHDEASGRLAGNSLSGFTSNWQTGVQAKVLRNFSAGNYVDIIVDGTGRTRFGLNGSATAISALQRCAGKIILPRANTLSADLQRTLKTANGIIGLDSRTWLFFRLDSNSGWTIALTENIDGFTTHRMHYTFNRGVKAWVDISYSDTRGTCLTYWNFPNRCKFLGE